MPSLRRQSIFMGGPDIIRLSIYSPSYLSASCYPAQGSKGSGVNEIIDGFDLVGRQVPDEHKLVNALDIECPSVRKLDMQKKLQKKKKK